MLEMKTLTQTGLRLQLVTLEMQSMIDRSIRSSRLHSIIDYCVPRRLLRSVTVWAQRGDEGLMRLTVEIDYEEHDRQIALTYDGLPDDLAVQCGAKEGAVITDGPHTASSHGCPTINRVIELFVRLARERGLCLTWAVCFAWRQDELETKFCLRPNSDFLDRTVGAVPVYLAHSEFPELGVIAAANPEILHARDQAVFEPRKDLARMPVSPGRARKIREATSGST